MAKRKRTRRDSDPPDASWIDDLAFDPADHPDARALVGYVRKSPGSKALQLYASLDLNEYVEIQPKDILDQKPFGGDEEPRRTVLWLKGSAVVRGVRVSRLDDQAAFLVGRLADRHLQSISSLVSPINWPGTRTPTIMTSPSVCFVCTTGSAACP